MLTFFSALIQCPRKDPALQMSLSSRLQMPEGLSKLWVSLFLKEVVIGLHLNKEEERNHICLCRVSGSDIPVDVWLM